MNRTYEFIAKTADEAIDKALLDLKCSLSDLDIDIQEHKASGLFGFLKPKEIKIIAKFKEEYIREKELERAKAEAKKPSKPEKSEVREQKSEIKEQKSEAKEQKAQGKEQKPQAKAQPKTESKVQKEKAPKSEKEVKAEKDPKQEKEVRQEKESKFEPKKTQHRDPMQALESQDSEEMQDIDFEEDDTNAKKSVEITDLTLEERNRIKDLAYEFIMDLLDSMQIDAEITLIEKRQQLLVLLNIREGKQLIGYRGETLFAIQYLLSVYMNYKMDKYLRIKLDINNYRKKKEIELKRRVMSVAKKVEKTNKPIKLEEMHASDRHFIHMQLKRNKKVYTKSEGVEPNRCVVILPAEH